MSAVNPVTNETVPTAMIFPPIDVLEEKCENKFALAVLTYKRAKELMQNQRALVEVAPGEKVISVAAKEIYFNKVYPIFDE